VNVQGNLPPTQAEDANLEMEHGHYNPDPRNDRSTSIPAQQVPLCSVLNTIVDHVMVPPTPMEPQEYQEVLAGQQQQEKEQERDLDSSPQLPAQTTITPTTNGLLVPVMRIFGPVLRRDDDHHDDSTKRPTQSACLYIHGAFPYMLARPATAGPDGSLHRSSHLMHNGSGGSSKLTPSGHIDWDDVESVERILPVLQENLQAAIQSSMQESNFGNNNKN
jgi:hypothetical protein